MWNIFKKNKTVWHNCEVEKPTYTFKVLLEAKYDTKTYYFVSEYHNDKWFKIPKYLKDLTFTRWCYIGDIK